MHRESQFDLNKRKYADIVTDELSKTLFSAESKRAQKNERNVSNVAMGWALKKQKSSSRFPEKVKAYLNDKFLIGEETGNKESPTQVAREMRRERDDTGDRLFVGADCLGSQQVAEYFSRLAATKRKHGSLTTTVVNWEEVEEFMDDGART